MQIAPHTDDQSICEWKALSDFVIEARIGSGALSGYPAPEGGIFVVRPPGEFAPRNVRALIDILLERFGGSA